MAMNSAANFTHMRNPLIFTSFKTLPRGEIFNMYNTLPRWFALPFSPSYCSPFILYALNIAAFMFLS